MASPKLAPSHSFQVRDPKHMTRTNNLPGKKHWVPGDIKKVFEEAYQEGAKVAADDTWWGGPTLGERREQADGTPFDTAPLMGAAMGAMQPMPGFVAGANVLGAGLPGALEGSIGSLARGYRANGLTGAAKDLATTTLDHTTPGSVAQAAAGAAGAWGASKGVQQLLRAPTGLPTGPAPRGLTRFVPRGLGTAVAAGAAMGNGLSVADEYDRATHGGGGQISDDMTDRAAEYLRSGNPSAAKQVGAAAHTLVGAPQDFLNQQRAQWANGGVYGDNVQQAARDKAFTADNTSQYPQLVQQRLDAYRKTFQPEDFESPEQYAQHTQTMAEIGAAQWSNKRWSNGRGHDPHTTGPNAFERHLDAGEIPGIQPGTSAAQLAQHMGRELGGGTTWSPNGGVLSDPTYLSAFQKASQRGVPTPTANLPLPNTSPNFKNPSVQLGAAPAVPAPVVPQASVVPTPK